MNQNTYSGNIVIKDPSGNKISHTGIPGSNYYDMNLNGNLQFSTIYTVEVYGDVEDFWGVKWTGGGLGSEFTTESAPTPTPTPIPHIGTPRSFSILNEWGGYNMPIVLDVNPANGDVYVIDWSRKGGDDYVVLHSSTGVETHEWVASDGHSPQGISVDSSQNVYWSKPIAGYERRIYKTNFNGQAMNIGPNEYLSGDFFDRFDVSHWDGSINILSEDVSNGGTPTIVRYIPGSDTTTVFPIDDISCSGSIDTTRSESGGFGITVDSSGNFYVTVRNGGDQGCVKKYDSNGNFIKKWGEESNTNSYKKLMDPKNLDIDKDGNVYVLSTNPNYSGFGNSNGGGYIKKFDSDGNFIGQWFLPFIKYGQQSDISINKNNSSGTGDVYISSRETKKVYRLSLN
tara:strand:+ start:400 stop:1593 length:1194 start_codon:yes stop_codon:yes gene_type:complete